MFSRVSAVSFTLLFALLATASPTPEIVARDTNQCNTGSISCCNSVQSVSNPGVASLLGLLGVVVGDITGQVGVGCSPITVIGAGSGSTCDQQPVCCTGNQFGGLINIGCSPITLGL
ncbi:hypothetical protein SERLA73DRAFT_115110 [Serpula lacrymans var. lacrymans S7.3]|uniref:Hydrophobin n=2 Tax=Serpula lacrymans var. lacrymans TaxID=341189 RepID=F8QC58_SERL3|nr:hydrophobin [Serpula lacrymans var. lacrymans S7.9]EGN94177.1 hypothetical protein SERLA73DRAFT_115110 [Serpula lacrymans var. lacrymans S7.3]EGO19734.1 hydrophobin [Serpula lacrymans var. lacrymans S7.9]